MRVAVVDCDSAKVGDIARHLQAHGASTTTVPLSQAHPGLLVDAVVVSGGPRLFTSEPGLIDMFQFLDALEVPVLGICLGHQALALRAGSRVFLGPARRDHDTVVVTHPHPLFDGLGASPRFREDHCEGVDLPDGWTLLASSQHYAVEAMAHATLPRFGVQFHPEASGDDGARLLRNFLTFCRAGD